MISHHHVLYCISGMTRRPRSSLSRKSADPGGTCAVSTAGFPGSTSRRRPPPLSVTSTVPRSVDAIPSRAPIGSAVPKSRIFLDTRSIATTLPGLSLSKLRPHRRAAPRRDRCSGWSGRLVRSAPHRRGATQRPCRPEKVDGVAERVGNEDAPVYRHHNIVQELRAGHGWRSTTLPVARSISTSSSMSATKR